MKKEYLAKIKLLEKDLDCSLAEYLAAVMDQGESNGTDINDVADEIEKITGFDSDTVWDIIDAHTGASEEKIAKVLRGENVYQRRGISF